MPEKIGGIPPNLLAGEEMLVNWVALFGIRGFALGYSRKEGGGHGEKTDRAVFAFDWRLEM